MNKRIIPLLCASTILGASCNPNKGGSMGNTTEDLSKVTFDVEFHRGGRNARPENTLYSYLYAIEQGATTIECDMQLINDSEIILSHEPLLDPNIFRTEDGEYVPDVPGEDREDMRTMSLAKIKTYDVAKVKPGTDYYNQHGKTQKTPEHASIPTIDELFKLVKECGRKVQINIETKIYHPSNNAESPEPRGKIETNPDTFIKIFYEKVKQYDLEDQVILQSFDWASLVSLKKQFPNTKIRTSALSSSQAPWGGVDDYLWPFENVPSPYLAGLDIKDFHNNPVEALNELNKNSKVIDIFSPYAKELTQDLTEQAHKGGMKVLPWNANTRKEIEAMYDLGVDGIISDNGELLYEVILSKGDTLFKKKPMNKSPYHIN